MRRDLQEPYPPGIPTPFVARTPPYPTRYHGGNWTRPQTSPLRFYKSEQSAFKPSDYYAGLAPEHFVLAPPRIAGMGSLGAYDGGAGIFRTSGTSHGGGMFNRNLAGLGQSDAEQIAAILAAQKADAAMKKAAAEEEKAAKAREKAAGGGGGGGTTSSAPPVAPYVAPPKEKEGTDWKKVAGFAGGGLLALTIGVLLIRRRRQAKAGG